jgi:hypothetical protein
MGMQAANATATLAAPAVPIRNCRRSTIIDGTATFEPADASAKTVIFPSHERLATSEIPAPALSHVS